MFSLPRHEECQNGSFGFIAHLRFVYLGELRNIYLGNFDRMKTLQNATLVGNRKNVQDDLLLSVKGLMVRESKKLEIYIHPL